MGMINCGLHGWSGVASMTPSAAEAFDNLKGTDSILLVELVFDGIPFFLYSLKEELPFEKTKSVDQIFEVNNEHVLDKILGTLVPRCGKCVNDVLKRS